MNTQVAPHEILELHELLNTNLIGAKKMTANMSMVQDQALKSFMKDSLNNKKAKIQELQNFINSTIGNQTNNQGNQNNQGNGNQ
jgi:hypothetical protein